MNSMIEFQRPDGKTSAGFIAVPDDAPPATRPGVILIQEWWGLKPHILDIAGRFATTG